MKITMCNGKTHYTWSFSIAMLVIARGYCILYSPPSLPVASPVSSVRVQLFPLRRSYWAFYDNLLSHGNLLLYCMAQLAMTSTASMDLQEQRNGSSEHCTQMSAFDCVGMQV